MVKSKPSLPLSRRDTVSFMKEQFVTFVFSSAAWLLYWHKLFSVLLIRYVLGSSRHQGEHTAWGFRVHLVDCQLRSWSPWHDSMWHLFVKKGSYLHCGFLLKADFLDLQGATFSFMYLWDGLIWWCRICHWHNGIWQGEVSFCLQPPIKM